MEKQQIQALRNCRRGCASWPRLRTAGLRVWFDEWNIRPGDHIPFIFIFPNAPKHQSGEEPKPELRKEASKWRIRFALVGRIGSPDWVAKVAFTGLAAF